MATNPATAPAMKPMRLTITKLMAAVKDGNVEAIRSSLLAYGLPVNVKKTTDYDILQLALQYGKRNIAKLLLQAGCNVNDPAGNSQSLSTALYMAVRDKDDEIVTMLLQKGAIIDIKDNCSGKTPVHLAADRRATNILLKLLDYETNVNLCDNEDMTALQIIIYEAEYRVNKCKIDDTVHPDIVRKLLTKGATVNCKNQQKQTPLHVAAKLKQKDILLIMLPFCTNVNQRDSEENTILHTLLSTVYANSGCSKESQNIEIVNALLKHGANLTLLNRCGQSPAHLAAKNKHLKILLELLQYVRNVNQADCEGRTILHYLLYNFESISKGLVNEFTQLLKVLVSKGAKANLKSRKGDTALKLAAHHSNKQPNLLWILIEGNLHVSDDDGNTVLHLLAREPDVNMKLVNKLIKNGLKVDAKNLNQDTPVQTAARFKRLTLLRKFLPHVVDLNSHDNKDGDTIMHDLLQNSAGVELSKIVDELLKRGASVDLRNYYGVTPLFYAAKSKQTQLLLHLLRRSQDLAGQVVVHDRSDSITNFKYTLLHLVLSDMCVDQQKQVDDTGCEILRILLKNGAPIDQRAVINLMPIHETVLYKHPELMAIFTQYVSRANVSGNEGKSLLYFLEELPSNAFQDSEKQVLELVKILLRNGASVQGICFRHRSVLDYARKNGKLLMLLVKYGEDLAEATDWKGNTLLLLHLQGKERSLDTVRSLVAKGVEVDTSNDDGETAVHLAAKFRENEILQFLLSQSDRVSACDKHSVLHTYLQVQKNAVEEEKELMERSLEVVRTLVDKGAEVDARNENGQTAIHLAAKTEEHEILHFLMSRSSDVNARDKDGNTVLHVLLSVKKITTNDEGDAAEIAYENKILLLSTRMLLQRGVSVDAKNKADKTHLRRACFNLHAGVCRLLVQHGADPLARDEQGNTALHFLSEGREGADDVDEYTDDEEDETEDDEEDETEDDEEDKTSDGNEQSDDEEEEKTDEVNKANVKEKSTEDEEANNEGHMDATEREMLVFFLRHGCGVNERNKNGLTALHVAATNDRSNLVKLLIENGAIVNCPDTLRGDMPLHRAAAEQRDKVVELLLQHGADVNARRTADGASALQLVLRHGISFKRHLGALLLEHGADPEQRDDLGRAALHWACEHDNELGLELLLEHGADVSARNREGREPDFVKSKSTMIRIVHHVAKLQVAGVALSRFQRWVLRKCANNYLKVDKDKYNSTLKAEIKAMRKVVMDPCTLLYDLLHMSANRLAVYRDNLVLQKILASKSLPRRFPEYALLIRACARLGQRRAKVLEAASESLSRLSGNPLPQCCSHKIFELMSDECLRCVIKAGSGNLRKRKMSTSAADESCKLAKQARRR